MTRTKLTFVFTRAVREDAIRLIRGIGGYGNAIAALFGADWPTTAAFGFALYVTTHVLALYLLGLQTRKDAEGE